MRLARPAVLVLLGCVVAAPCARAQPAPASVVAQFKKNGVTSVKVVNTTKEWDGKKQKYYWKVSLVKTQPVPPAEVDGVAGVTLETHVVADYDLGSSAPYWSGVTFAEYKGIDLPTPSAAELSEMLARAAAADPKRFFRSSAGKLGIDRIWTDEPRCEWINPKKLNFRARMQFRQEVSDTEVGRFDAPLTVTLVRAALKAPWAVDFASQEVEQQQELERMKKGEAGAGAVQMADQPAEARNRAEVERLRVPTPPQYASPEALAADFVVMLHSLSREQFQHYCAMILQPELRCDGCSVTPNPSGEKRCRAILETAYDGAGTFRDQFCREPQGMAVENGAVFFKNKRGGGESQIVFRKVGERYFLDGVTLRVSKDAGDSAALKAAECPAGTTRGGGSAAPAGGAAGAWKVGDHVMVEENGKWYPSVILKAEPGRYFIHYDGFAAKYDTWVGPERVRNP